MKRNYRSSDVKMLKSIADNYNYAIVRINELKRNNSKSQSSDDIIKSYLIFLSKVDNVLKIFDPLERTILDREFFAPLPNRWWCGLYSRATYFRLRSGVVKKFLEKYNYE